MKRAILMLAVLGLSRVVPNTANAAMLLASRNSDYQITFGNNFSGTNVLYKVTDDFTGNSGDQLDGYGFGVPSLAQNISVTSSGAVSISNLSVGIPVTTFDLAMTGTGTGLTGTMQEQYNVGAGTGPGQSWVTAGTSNGLSTLQFVGDGSETGTQVPASGLPFTVTMSISGNWTNIGTSTGDISFIGSLDAGWTQGSSSYDSSTNTTSLSWSTSNYQAGDTGGIDFILYGSAVSAVPEPATMTMLGIGIAGLVAYRWRRRRQPVPA
jgi:hypothetical protein